MDLHKNSFQIEVKRKVDNMINKLANVGVPLTIPPPLDNGTKSSISTGTKSYARPISFSKPCLYSNTCTLYTKHPSVIPIFIVLLAYV